MKKLLSLLALALVMAACNNASDTKEVNEDSIDTSPVNDNISNPNRIPGSNTPGEAMGNGDTSSYDRMSQKTDSGR